MDGDRLHPAACLSDWARMPARPCQTSELESLGWSTALHISTSPPPWQDASATPETPRDASRGLGSSDSNLISDGAVDPPGSGFVLVCIRKADEARRPWLGHGLADTRLCRRRTGSEVAAPEWLSRPRLDGGACGSRAGHSGIGSVFARSLLLRKVSGLVFPSPDGAGTARQPDRGTMKVLVVDIGGSHVKLLASDQPEPRRFDSGKDLTPQMLVERVQAHARGWEYNLVALGYPGAVGPVGPVGEPGNLCRGWVGFDFAAAFGRAV